MAGYTRNSFTVEVKNNSQASKIKNVTTVDGVLCKIEDHPTYNVIKGLIYISDSYIDSLDDFKQYLQDQTSIANITKADFIKTRDPETQAYIIEFCQDYLPYSLYIPGERSNTIVHPFRNKPMICNKCQSFNHREKFCTSEETVCRWCSASGHRANDCISETPKCFHCSQEHSCVSKDCHVYKKEQEILDIQVKQKVTIRRARQIYDQAYESTVTSVSYHTHFDCTMNEESKKKISPWLLEKCLQNSLGGKPKSIRSKNPTTFIIEVQGKRQSTEVTRIKSINGYPVKIEPNRTIGSCKGLVYIYNYNMSEFEHFKQNLITDLGLSDAVEATWIKSKSNLAIPLLLTFRGNLPTYVTIPGEQAKSKVYEYKQKPLLCKRCQTYNHRDKYCQRNVVCRQCGEADHPAEGCNNPTKCFHCGNGHEAGNSQCIEYKFEEELLSVQKKEGVPRYQARFIINERNPNFRNDYANALKQQPKNSTDNPKPNEYKRRRSPSGSAERPQKKNLTQVVCESPASGRYFVASVDLSEAGPTPSQEIVMQDLENYQDQLQRASKIPERRTNSLSRKKSGSRH